MRLIAVSDNECKFQRHCVGRHCFHYENFVRISLNRLFVRKHNEEETPLFAENLYGEHSEKALRGSNDGEVFFSFLLFFPFHLVQPL